MGEVVSLFVSRETGLRWFRVVICGLGWLICGLGLTWEVYVIKTLSVFILSQKHILGVKKVVLGGLEVVWGVSTDQLFSMAFLLPSADSRRVVSYKRKYVHKVLVNCLVQLAQQKVWVGELKVRT